MYAKATPAVSDILADAAHANPVAISPPAMPLLRLVRDESPVVVVWRGRTDGRVVRLPYQFYHAKPSRRLLIACLAPGESPPAPEHGVVYLPWCDAEQTRAFVQLAGGDADAKVYADWLVPRNPSVLLTGGLRRLDEIIAGYPQHLLAGVNAAALCHAYPCDRRTLERYFHTLYNTTPGHYCRVWRLLFLTAQLMQHEARAGFYRRRGNSPLPAVPGDYRRSLQRVFGLSYSELLHAARDEHWLAVLMRRGQGR